MQDDTLGNRETQDETVSPYSCIHLLNESSPATDYDSDLMPLEVHRVMHGDTDEVLKAATTSRRKVMQRNEWPKFKAAEAKQLQKHFGHKVYGKPIKRRHMPVGASVYHQIWSYYIKPNGE